MYTVIGRLRFDGQKAHPRTAPSGYSSFESRWAGFNGRRNPWGDRRRNSADQKPWDQIQRCHNDRGPGGFCAARFESDDQAERFAADLRKRYGPTVVQDLATGRNDGLAKDFPEVEKQKTIGLSLRDAKIAREKLSERDNARDQGWEL